MGSWPDPIFYANRFSGDLKNGTGYPTFDAYNSTSPAVWGQSDSHFCCASWLVGCKSVAAHGVRSFSMAKYRAQSTLASFDETY
jgi:hypothetical protein